MAADWQPRVDADEASDRILDAAGRCFARDGVATTTIGDIADEAGCSRPTVYRYFTDRDALRLAFVEREARRVGVQARRAGARLTDPTQRLVTMTQAAIAGVRADPVLAAWFTPSGFATASAVAATSTVVAHLAGLPTDTPTDADAARRARWLVRVILSLLAAPAANEREERVLLTQFVAPVVLPAG